MSNELKHIHIGDKVRRRQSGDEDGRMLGDTVYEVAETYLGESVAVHIEHATSGENLTLFVPQVTVLLMPTNANSEKSGWIGLEEFISNFEAVA
jgi:hypothetical protein